MNRKLYIIGNGFDLNHGLNTSYSNYRDFLIRYYEHEFRDLEKFPWFFTDFKDMWSDLENSLTLDKSGLINSIIEKHDFNLSVDDPAWIRAGETLHKESRFIYNFTGKYFIEWINLIC